MIQGRENNRAGVHVWAVGCGKQLAFLEIEDARAAIFHPSGTTLLTVGSPGIQGWPLVCIGSSFRIGSPQLLASQASLTTASIDRKGNSLVLVRNGRICLLDLKSHAERL